MIDAFNSTSRYLDDLHNIDNIHFEQMVHRIYPAETLLNKDNASDKPFQINLSTQKLITRVMRYLIYRIHNDKVSTKIYNKRDDFDFGF